METTFILSLIDGGGKEVYRRRGKANWEAVNEALDPYWPQIEALGVESTFNWYWLVDGLPRRKGKASDWAIRRR